MVSALVVVARAPVPGRCKSRLWPALGPEGAAALARAMLEDCLAHFAPLPASRHVLYLDGAAPGLDVPPPWEVLAQPPGELASRLLHAMQLVGPPLVFVGSDAPLVPRAALAELVRAPAPRCLSLGPAADGGFWCLGLDSAPDGLFDGVPLGTAGARAGLEARAETLGLACHHLPESFDVDTPADLERLRHELAAAPEKAPRTAAALRPFTPSATRC